MVKRKKNEPEQLPFQIHTGTFNPDRVRFLVYGESGAGKTRFACTWPEAIVVDIDDGLASVDWEVARWPVGSWSDVLEAFYFLADPDNHDFKTIIIDSLNEAQRLALKNTVEAFPNVRRPYDSLASESDYGKMLTDFDDTLRAFKALPYNLVLIAQVTSRQFDIDTVQPYLIGKNSSRAVCRMMDCVGYLYKQDESLQMGFELNDFVGKDRSGALPPVVENPTYSILERYWRQK